MEVGMKINKSDYQKLQRKLANLKAFDRRGLGTEIAKTGAEIARLAVRAAPVRKGKNKKDKKGRHGGSLRQSISFSGKGKQVQVVADKIYAPYIEFGTGGMVKLDDMLELGIPSSYAMQFKGKGIREVNLPARPFFFSSARIGFKNLYDRVNRRLNKIIK
tara:strand:+ start:1057 stop:1536 length:480 start_codon:yes stop_codon:yes gene_type:complete